MAINTMTVMNVRDINFIQNGVSHKFQDGNELIETFDKLVGGRLLPSHLGQIEVAQYKGSVYAFDGNRRLLLFKKLERAGLLTQVTVNFNRSMTEGTFRAKYSIDENGQNIKVRGSTDFDDRINGVLRKYGKREI